MCLALSCYSMQTAVSSERMRRQGGNEASEDMAGDAVTEDEALDLQELFKKAIMSSAV